MDTKGESRAGVARAVAGALVGVFLLAACTAAPAPVIEGAGPGADELPVPVPSSAPGPSVGSSGASDPRLGERVEIRLPETADPRILTLNSWGAGVVMSSSPGAPLVWFDLGTREPTEITRPEARWEIDFASASDEWLAWVEYIELPDGVGGPVVSWRIRAHSFATGRTALVREGSGRVPLTPAVLVSGALLFFDVYDSVAASPVSIFTTDLATGDTELVIGGEGLGSYAWDGQRLLVSVTETPPSPGPGASDIYVVDDGVLRAVTQEDAANGVEFHDGHLIWGEPTENSDGTVGADRIWVRPWPDDGEAVLVEERQSSAASLGSGFVVDWSLGEETVFKPLAPVIISIDDPSGAFELVNPEGTRLSVRPQAFGDKVAWVAEAIDGDRPGEGSVLVVQTLDLAG